MSDIVVILAQELFRAYETRRPIPMLSVKHQLTVDSAYSIQNNLVALHKLKGRQIAGFKVGMTNPIKRNLMGVSEPTYGVLFKENLFHSGENVTLTRAIQPRIEPEIAFVIQRNLKGPGLTLSDVLESTFVLPALEITDSRFQNWQMTILDGIADNAASWGLVLGNSALPALELDLRTIGVVFEKNDVLLATAAGAASLKHPGRAVQWLVNRLGKEGVVLQQGQVILSGALTDSFPLDEGLYRAEFGNGLGSVEAII